MFGYYAISKIIVMCYINYPLFSFLNTRSQKQRQSHKGKQIWNRFSDFRNEYLKKRYETF